MVNDINSIISDLTKIDKASSIDDFKKETEASLKTLDSMYTANKDLWIESIFNHIVKE